MLVNERPDDRIHGLLDFAVGQRAVRRLEREPECQTDFAVRHILALISIELAHVDERRGGCRSDRATNGFGRQGVGDENRDIADDEWMTRKRLRESGRRRGGRGKSIEIQLESSPSA